MSCHFHWLFHSNVLMNQRWYHRKICSSDTVSVRFDWESHYHIIESSPKKSFWTTVESKKQNDKPSLPMNSSFASFLTTIHGSDDWAIGWDSAFTLHITETIGDTIGDNYCGHRFLVNPFGRLSQRLLIFSFGNSSQIWPIGPISDIILDGIGCKAGTSGAVRRTMSEGWVTLPMIRHYIVQRIRFQVPQFEIRCIVC